MLRVMDLFSGIGGFSLGLRRTGGFKTVCYCEIDSYCRSVLEARMRGRHLDSAPICKDVRKLDGRKWDAEVIVGGFPCQDVSHNGLMRGITGERSGLWVEVNGYHLCLSTFK